MTHSPAILSGLGTHPSQRVSETVTPTGGGVSAVEAPHAYSLTAEPPCLRVVRDPRNFPLAFGLAGFFLLSGGRC